MNNSKSKHAPEFETVADAEKVLKPYRTVDKLRNYQLYLEQLGLPGVDTYTHKALAERVGSSREKVTTAMARLRSGPPEGGE